MHKHLPHPFNYYYSKYAEAKCPFCNSELECTTENEDLIHCTTYGKEGYLSNQML